MRNLHRLAHLGITGGRAPLSDVIGQVRRALAAAADRRQIRPLQDLDDWSDQAEVAYYEACRSARSV